MNIIKQGPIESLRDMNIPMALALFVALPTATGLQEGVPLVGFAIGAFFFCYLVLLQMIFPI